ncbi:NAD-dependent epimerase/dehydratase family protein [Cylindrospermopsis curvispora]|uniref:NAD(P)-dependent oxidoreductase n=1 Tax=Cylindrospermopsis curvispora GIHE-G1 TaxID=2666332 RepID=A0A7H0F1K7_9CYAN|nr:NAD(P)-dependent oxidoreductase [Cylindrospermopsis curvispora]QNP29923.1 NAD(P)-dependent oxidoreductase [Cylindrospermopsis curvispora GIHE-G1]
MRIAVTGATGFIGRHVVNALVSNGYDVLAVGRSAPLPGQKLSFLPVDLLQEKNHHWISEYKPSHLLHLAWYAEHGKYWTSPLNLNWCDATVHLVNAFVNQGGKRVVVAGSCAEYDWSFGYCHEVKTPSRPSTLYGTAKDCARRMSEKICALQSVPLAWGRIFLPFGLGESSQRLIPSITHALSGLRPPFPIRVHQWRDILPVEIVADGLVFLVAQESSGVFNICSGKPTQLSEVIQKIGVMLNRNIDLLMVEADSSLYPDYFLLGDNQSLVSQGWLPEYNIWESLNVYVSNLTEL